MPALTTLEHRAVAQETRSRRNVAGQERRAVGLRYTKRPEVVTIVEADAPDGGTLLLATSDAVPEHGRYFQLERQADGKWVCSCALFMNCGSCAHVGAAQARDQESESDTPVADVSNLQNRLAHT